MLSHYFHQQLVRKGIKDTIIFQQDGAPAHYSKEVREWLKWNLPGRWIERRGPIEWAPRSPDLSPLDFFLWGYLKQKVYSKPVKDLEELRKKIKNYIRLIEKDVLEKVFLNLEKRLELIQEIGGGHFEQFL